MWKTQIMVETGGWVENIGFGGKHGVWKIQGLTSGKHRVSVENTGSKWKTQGMENAGSGGKHGVSVKNNRSGGKHRVSVENTGSKWKTQECGVWQKTRGLVDYMGSQSQWKTQGLSEKQRNHYFVQLWIFLMKMRSWKFAILHCNENQFSISVWNAFFDHKLKQKHFVRK